MKFQLDSFLRRFEACRELERENHSLRAHRDEWERFVPHGHFYSPLPTREDIAGAFGREDLGPPFAGIDLNEAGQFERLERVARWYSKHPFPEGPAPDRRYYLTNPSYGAEDALMLHGVIRDAQPKRIVEIGSGMSSAAMLDINDDLGGAAIALTFVDPETSRLRVHLRPADLARVNLIEKRVQDVPLALFTQLEANDILFIDSSHVSKVGSDVNHLFFHVLPVLAPGVLIHIHDITWRLEYPPEWLHEGRAWNEQYLLRAFLMYNREFRIELFTSWLARVKQDFLTKNMPRCARGAGGQLWLKRIAS